MLTLMEAELTLPAGEKLNQSLGSVMQGILVEHMNEEWADAMHAQTARPYSQYVTIENGRVLWRIGTLTDAAYENVFLPIKDAGEIFSRQRGYAIGVGPFRTAARERYEDLEARFWGAAERIHHIDMRFLTSASFKNNGGYVIFPEPFLLWKNLIRKWNDFSDASVLREEKLGDHLGAGMRITDYHLHMHPFSLEGRRINAFRGSVRLGAFTNDTTARMAGMLAAFAVYAGTGMKTALGMGGTETDIGLYREKE